jgi:hypothetical protein
MRALRWRRAGASLALALAVWLGARMAQAQSLGEDEERRTVVVLDLAEGALRAVPSATLSYALVPTLSARTRVLGGRGHHAEVRIDVEAVLRGSASTTVDGRAIGSPGNPEIAARLGGALGEGWLWARLGWALPVSGLLDPSVARPAIDELALVVSGAQEPQRLTTGATGPTLGLAGAHRGDWHYVSFNVAFATSIGTASGVRYGAHTGFVLALHHFGVTVGVRTDVVWLSEGRTDAVFHAPGEVFGTLAPFARITMGIEFVEAYGRWEIGLPYGLGSATPLHTFGVAAGVAIE